MTTTNAPSTSTRDQFLATAQALFAKKGFYGVSIAAIAEPMGLSKQALLHHFGSKEKLYGEVLERVTGVLLENARVIAESDATAAERFAALVMAQYQLQVKDEDAARLVMRELLDNEHRANTAGNWYLKPYLDLLIETLTAIDHLHKISEGQALALVYQILGAVHYFVVSRPTLEHMFGKATYSEAESSYAVELTRLIHARLAADVCDDVI